MARVQEDKNTVTIRDGSAARTREGWSLQVRISYPQILCRPHARGMEELNFEFLPMTSIDMPTCTRGWGNASLSDSLGRDSRAVRALAYMTICVADSTGRNQAWRTGLTEINVNGGRRCRRDGVGISPSP